MQDQGFHIRPDAYQHAETDLDKIKCETVLARSLDRDTRSIDQKLADYNKSQPSYEELLMRAEAQRGLESEKK